jgi:predicted PhzF superfamily epimerase YddE/YHI9
VINIKQGENLGRPSRLDVEAATSGGELGDIYVSGNVCKISQSTLLAVEYL